MPSTKNPERKSKIEISAVIPTKGRAQDLLLCVSSLLKQTLMPDEIIIVDSSEDEKSGLLLKQSFPQSISRIKYIHSKVNTNEARNIGIQQSSREIVFFFDDDVVLDRDYIEEVVRVFVENEDKEIGGVMGNIKNMKRDTLSLKTKIRRLFFLDHFGNGQMLPSGLPTWIHGTNKKAETSFLSGCMSAYRREVLRVFTFDPDLGRLSGYTFLDDVDMSVRVSRKYKLAYTPSARLEHNPSRKARINPKILKRQLIANHFYLFKKNTPKHFQNVFAFFLSIVGILVFILLFERNAQSVVGWFLGFIDILLRPHG
jgi:GT2 family glycosyltransferase